MLKKVIRKSQISIGLIRKPFEERKKSEAKRIRSRYANYYNKYNVQDNLILYESYFGRGMVCNPYAIFKEFLNSKIFDSYIHVWVLEDPNEHDLLIREYKSFKNVVFIKRLSDEYLKYLVSAKFLINNTSFPLYFSKKEEQIYVNTWHSITVKTLGFDVPDGIINSANMLRNFLATDYLISPNIFTTKIFKHSFKLDGIFEGKIIEDGHPRNDLVLDTNRSETIKKQQRYGINIDPSKKIILYAPTWKGESFLTPEYSIDEYIKILDFLQNNINTEEYQVLIKPHHAVYRHMKNNNNIHFSFVPSTIDVNELLSIVDILISDYSSIYFDFLVTGKPILFYIPDLDDYKSYRGVYFKVNELPGPSSKNLMDICRWINNIKDIQNQYKDIYAKTKQWACQHDNGEVSKRVIDIIFHKNESNKNVISGLPTNKIKILIYGGTFKTNGVTSSLLSLLNQINYKIFDVSLIAINAKDKMVYENICKVNPNVRVLSRGSTYNSTLLDDIRDQYVRYFGIGNSLLDIIFPKGMYQMEFSRCFGKSRFDYVIDFSGYGPFFNYLIMQAKDAKRIIWQHADLEADRKRKVKGQEKLYRERAAGIRATISLYKYYDKIVSCSKSVMEINKTKLANRNTWNKFTYATNTVNSQRILDGIREDETINIEGIEYLLKQKTSHNEALCTMELLRYPSKNNINFVTMGRLSPEKNHKNLIKAFSQVYKEFNNCRLYIIGEGDLRKSLENLIAKLNLSKAVFLVGNLSNPFSIMNYCDCFVFVSRHEGQGLVVLEARMIGLPIIVTNFDAVKDLVVDNGQLIIEKDTQSIYEGLKAFLEGKVTSDYKFDPEVYNRKCYQEFEKLFDKHLEISGDFNTQPIYNLSEA